MTDWREMEAGRELDRVVAERLGWTAFKREESDPNPFDGSVSYYYTALMPEHGYRRMISRYSADIGAALGLPKPDGYRRRLLERDDDGWVAQYVQDRSGRLYASRGEKAALAVTRAWLAMMEAQADD